jgi:hypothetical protein
VDFATLPLPHLIRVRLARAEVQARICSVPIDKDRGAVEQEAARDFFREVVAILLDVPDDPGYLADDLRTSLLDQVMQELQVLGITSDVRPALYTVAEELEKSLKT